MIIYLIIMFFLWKDTGFAKTNETLVEALEAIAHLRKARALSKLRKSYDRLAKARAAERKLKGLS